MKRKVAKDCGVNRTYSRFRVYHDWALAYGGRARRFIAGRNSLLPSASDVTTALVVVAALNGFL